MVMTTTSTEIATAEAVEDETLTERRLRFLSQRNAGATFDAIAALYNKKQIEAAIAAERDPSSAKTISATTVRKDVERAKLDIVGQATREGMIAETYSVILDVRRANYGAMAGGDIDAAKVVLATVQQQRDLFGLDAPKRAVVGVGTDVEFSETLLALIQQLDTADAAKELATAAASERPIEIIDAEVVSEAARSVPQPNPFVPQQDSSKAWSNVEDSVGGGQTAST